MPNYYFRSFCTEWCEEVREEVVKYIIYELGDIFREFSPNTTFLRKDTRNYATDQFVFQIYFDEDSRTVFLTYDIDNLARYNYDPKEIIKRINKRLNNNFQRITKRRLQIVDYYHYDSYQSNSNHRVVSMPINIETYSYWKCPDGMYRFITGKNILSRIPGMFYPHNYRQVANDIMRINKKYQFNNPEVNEESVKSAFEELKDSYQKNLSIILKEIPDDEIYAYYLDCNYSEIKEKMK